MNNRTCTCCRPTLIVCTFTAPALMEEADMKARKRTAADLTLVEQRFLHDVAANIGYAFDGLSITDIDPHEYAILRSTMLRSYRKLAAVGLDAHAAGEALKIVAEHILLNEDLGEPYTTRRADLAIDLLRRWRQT